MKPRFNITFETVTDASAEHGDAAHRGYLPRSGNVPEGRNYLPKTPALFTLRQAADLMQPGGSAGIEADSCPISEASPPRWLNCQVTADWERPCVTLALHLGDISAASALRIARLFKCYGIKNA